MARHKDADWNLPSPQPDNWTQAGVAVLMDIRDELKINNAELKRLNALMYCHNTVAIPGILRKIEKRLATKLPLRAGRAK